MEVIASKEFKFNIIAISKINEGFFSVFSSKTVTYHTILKDVTVFENNKYFPPTEISMQFCCDEEVTRYNNMFMNVEKLLKDNNSYANFHAVLVIDKNLPSENEWISLNITFTCDYQYIIDEINRLN